MVPVLSGLRVLELGHFVAAPFCTRLLADLGADVLKIESLTGDPVRQWGEMLDGRSVWWSMHGRNKRSATLDLKSPKAQAIILELVQECDVVVENFRPGGLAKLGHSVEAWRNVKPDLVVAHISGYGQSGPGRDRAAFGVIGEAIGGLRYLTNHVPGSTNLPPVRVGVSIGDSIAGLYAAFGIMGALWQRDRVRGDRAARTIDVALTEAVLSMMEGMLPEFGVLGKVKQPTGGGIATAAPSNAYRTRDGAWVLIAANSEPLFARLARLMDKADLIGAPHYEGNAARVRNGAALDTIIGQWSQCYDADDLLTLLAQHDIPSSKVYTAEDCANDPQYRARGAVRMVDDPLLGPVLQAGVVPHVPECPGTVRWAGPDIGQHNREIYCGLLGMSEEDVEHLKSEGVI